MHAAAGTAALFSDRGALAKQQRDAPQSSRAYKGVDDPAEHGALTADAGWAGASMGGFGDIRPSIGAVLRLEAIVGHDFGAQLQLGYAFGLGRGGVHNVYLGLGSGF